MTHTAFQLLYQESRDPLYRYVVSMVSNPTVAEDIVAGAFERAWRGRLASSNNDLRSSVPAKSDVLLLKSE